PGGGKPGGWAGESLPAGRGKAWRLGGGKPGGWAGESLAAGRGKAWRLGGGKPTAGRKASRL
ncbi:MAG: ATP-dependent helicase, partial [Deltaproteobacteria bacterium]|nr:ATP-dependent helicase [Deltaproteobacteria bacterium]